MARSVLASIERGRLFGQDRVALRIGAFAAAYAAALATFPFGAAVAYDGWLATAFVLGAATLAVAAFAPWGRVPRALHAVPLLLYLGSIAAFREAHGGAQSGYAPLVFVAVVWAAMFGGWTMTVAVGAAAGATIALPPLVEGAPEYPSGELRRALLIALVATLVGLVIRALIEALLGEIRRREAAERALTRSRAAEIHDDVVQALAVADLALGLEDRATAGRAVRNGLAAAQAVAAEMLAETDAEVEPGALRRDHRFTLADERRPGGVIRERADVAAPLSSEQRDDGPRGGGSR